MYVTTSTEHRTFFIEEEVVKAPSVTTIRRIGDSDFALDEEPFLPLVSLLMGLPRVQLTVQATNFDLA